jgi:hypothetical protein
MEHSCRTRPPSGYCDAIEIRHGTAAGDELQALPTPKPLRNPADATVTDAKVSEF